MYGTLYPYALPDLVVFESNGIMWAARAEDPTRPSKQNTPRHHLSAMQALARHSVGYWCMDYGVNDSWVGSMDLQGSEISRVWYSAAISRICVCHVVRE